ncbi:MAG: hypothetical protein JXA03_07960 [Bacteroidales bacterium]|nr:hypothetical protein [Bacteroidales bacterium]
MKNIIPAMILLLLQTSVFSQKWEHIYGNPGTDESFQDVTEFYDKGYLLSGVSKANQGTWLIKTDINGNTLYEKTMVMEEWDISTPICTNLSVNQHGEIICTGHIYNDWLVKWIEVWLWITKLDSCGEIEWCKAFQIDLSNGSFTDIHILNDGKIITLADVHNYNTDESHTFIFCFSPNGNLLWKQEYWTLAPGGLHFDTVKVKDIEKIGNNYVISGDCWYSYPGRPYILYHGPFFKMLNSDFEQEWSLPFGTADTIEGKTYKSIALNDSVFMGAGVLSSDGLGDQCFLMFVDKYGNELGYKSILNDSIGTSVAWSYIDGIERINDSLFMISIEVGDSDTSSYRGEMIIDTSASIYHKVFHPKETGGKSGMIRTFDGKYAIGCSWEEADTIHDIYFYKINENLEQDTVYPGIYTYDSLCPYQIQSEVIDISDCVIIFVNVEEAPDPEDYFANLKTIPIRVFPNPARDVVTFGFENTEYLPPSPPAWSPACRSGKAGKPSNGVKWPSLSIYNIFGEKVHEERIYRNQGESRLNLGAWPQGMYIAVVLNEGRVVGRVKFVVR